VVTLLAFIRIAATLAPLLRLVYYNLRLPQLTPKDKRQMDKVLLFTLLIVALVALSVIDSIAARSNDQL
jgi:hypothetical protein